MREKGWALSYASKELKADKEVILEVLTHNGDANLCASEELKADKEVVLEAVKQNPPEVKCTRQVRQVTRSYVPDGHWPFKSP